MTEELTPNFELLEHIASGSDRMIDPKMAAEIKSLTGKDTAYVRDRLLFVLDMCVNGALSSDLVIKALDIEWRRLGGTVEPNNANCPWRNKM